MNEPEIVEAEQNTWDALMRAEAERQLKWDKRLMAMAEHVAQWSKDPSTKTGAVITSYDHRIVSVGFNGFPKGIADDDRWNDRAQKYEHVIHCEENAVMLAKSSVEECTLYTWPFGSCTRCASRMIQAGIARVVFPPCPADKVERWGPDLIRAENLYREAGVEVVPLP